MLGIVRVQILVTALHHTVLTGPQLHVVGSSGEILFELMKVSGQVDRYFVMKLLILLVK